ncbi:MAG: dihydrofolate reductase family protein, partial [Acidimicrobiales bacterium]
MSSIYVINHITLDGVMQSPGRPGEDTRDGFTDGGWSTAGIDDVLMTATNSRVAQAGGLRLLLGRRSYEGMLGYWNTQDSPFKDGLNAAAKYVVSTSLKSPLPWPNSTLLTGDVADSVASLKRESRGDLCIMGSGVLIQSLLLYRLIDEFLLFIHPRTLGTGRRIFPPGGSPGSFRLLEARPTTTGV